MDAASSDKPLVRDTTSARNLTARPAETDSFLPGSTSRIAKQCLVLGGAGFLGGRLCACLCARGWDVRVFDRSCRLKPTGQPGLAVQHVAADFRDKAQLEQALRGVSVVFHLLGSPRAQMAENDPSGDFQSYVEPTARLLDIARREANKIVFVSSGGTIYGEVAQVPIAEDSPTKPIGVLGLRSLLIEECLDDYQQRHGLEYTSLRVGNAYGEGQRSDRSQGAIAVFLACLLRGEPITVWGDGHVVRDYVYAGDVIEAIVRAAEHTGETRVFNIGSGQGFSLLEVIDLLCRAVGRPAQVRFLPARRFDVACNILDVERARQVLGWSPRVTFEEGVARMVSVAREAFLLPLARAA